MVRYVTLHKSEMEMASDAELDRLKAAQDLAFQQKQSAWQAQDQAWSNRQTAQSALDRAYAAKQDAYREQQGAWEELQRIRDHNGPRIDTLNSLQETAYQNMRRAFERASDAHNSRDGASARQYADEGHAYKTESQGYVAERRRLVQEIRDARPAYDRALADFRGKKADFDQAKAEYDRAKAHHQKKQSEYRQADTKFKDAQAAFKQRLEQVRDERQAQRGTRRQLAEQTGVPSEYLDNVWVSVKPDGTVHVYFGGAGSPNGPGHGHYVMDSAGRITYQRDPFAEHGSHNYTDAKQEYDDVVGAEASRPGEFGFNCRFRGYDAYVESNTNKQGRPKIDIYYGPNGPFGDRHHHAVAYRDDPHNLVSDQIR